MVRVRGPLMGIEASGSVGNVTYRRGRVAVTYAEGKPVPVDMRSRAQMYQRWDWQDYVQWWHQLTAAERAPYEVRARALRLTPFNVWMSDRLTLHSDLLGRWRFDELSGTYVGDSGGYENPGTMVGAVRVPGVFWEGVNFDGVDDRVTLPDAAEFDELAEYSVEVWVRADITHRGGVFSFHEYAITLGVYTLSRFEFYSNDVHHGVAINIAPGAGAYDGVWTHLVAMASATWTPKGRLYANGVLIGTDDPGLWQTANYPAATARLGRDYGGNTLSGALDNVVFYNRLLSEAEIKMRYERGLARL